MKTRTRGNGHGVTGESDHTKKKIKNTLGIQGGVQQARKKKMTSAVGKQNYEGWKKVSGTCGQRSEQN